MHYLVTGGLGVIGSLFTRELLRRGYDVTVLDDGSDKRHWFNRRVIESAAGGRARLSVIDGTTHDMVTLEAKGKPWCDSAAATTDMFDDNPVDLVIHAGASTGIPYSHESQRASDDDWGRNATGTLRLLQWLRMQAKPPQTVVLSSVKPLRVIDPRITPTSLARGQPLTGHEPMEADEPYAASKAAQVALCQSYGRSFGLPVSVLRCSNLWGPAACHGPRHGWLTWFAIQAALGLELEVQGTGNQARDMLWWLDVLNAVDKCHAALRNDNLAPGSVLTIGGGVKQMTTVGQAARKLFKLTHCRIREAPEKARSHEDDWVAVDNSAASRALESYGGWAPSVGIDDGLRLMLEWAWDNRDALLEVYQGA